jgi:hypothetical protein
MTKTITVQIQITEDEAQELQSFVHLSKLVESFGTPADTIAERVLDALLKMAREAARPTPTRRRPLFVPRHSGAGRRVVRCVSGCTQTTGTGCHASR